MQFIRADVNTYTCRYALIANLSMHFCYFTDFVKHQFGRPSRQLCSWGSSNPPLSFR